MPNVVPLTLPVYCHHCDQPVTLAYTAGPDGESFLNTWTCPYPQCGKGHARVSLRGRMFDVWTGHAADTADT